VIVVSISEMKDAWIFYKIYQIELTKWCNTNHQKKKNL